MERLVQYLAANKIEDTDQQRAVLLSVCHAAMYWLIRNLVSPKKPTELKFSEIVDIVKKHHNPNRLSLSSAITSICIIVGLENL